MTLPPNPVDWNQEHKEFYWPYEDWQYDVQNGDTKLGYKDWVEHNHQPLIDFPKDYNPNQE